MNQRALLPYLDFLIDHMHYSELGEQLLEDMFRGNASLAANISEKVILQCINIIKKEVSW